MSPAGQRLWWPPLALVAASACSSRGPPLLRPLDGEGAEGEVRGRDEQRPPPSQPAARPGDLLHPSSAPARTLTLTCRVVGRCVAPRYGLWVRNGSIPFHPIPKPSVPISGIRSSGFHLSFTYNFRWDAVRSACRDELLGRGTGRPCILCRGPGYRRCSFIEGLVESLRVACSNAAHDCDATPAYYDLQAHRMACAHVPGTLCPVRGCAFVAPMAELLDHFTAVHGWPLTTEECIGKSFDIVLRDGFNVVATADREGRNQQHLLLLNVARQPFGRTVSAVCIHPRPAADESLASAATKTVELELRYWAARHYQESEFNVPFVDLIDGLPNDLPHFVVPKSVHPDDDATVLVTAFLTIN
ncbi:hypothetical protein ACQ4PT_047016 [Festuca glaucescens]